MTCVEISLLELSDETEQLLQERLELLDPESCEPAGEDAAEGAELGVRLRYCLHYDPDEERLEHWVEYPKSGARAPSPASVTCSERSSSNGTNRSSSEPRAHCDVLPTIVTTKRSVPPCSGSPRRSTVPR